MSYLVVALPENTILQELQSIRNFFYQNNFRYHNKPCKDMAHITLAKISSNINNWFIEAWEGSLENEKQFMLTNFYTHTQEHLWSRQSQWKEKYPDWCWWFAVLFPNNRNLVNISNNIINVYLLLLQVFAIFHSQFVVFQVCPFLLFHISPVLPLKNNSKKLF